MSELIAILIVIYIYIKLFKLIKYIIKKIIEKIKDNQIPINYYHNKTYNNHYNKNKIHLSSEDKGKIGEDNLVYNLEIDLSYYKKILKNVYIPLKDNSTTEIDVILICNYGIFVFEVKHYNGWIYGYRKYNTWYQVFPNGNKKEFYNPINQNYYHIEKLKELLNIKKENLYKSIVYFSGNAEIKSYIENIESDYILTKNDYNIIDSIIKKDNIQLLTNFEVDEIYNKLNYCTNVDIITKLNHINRIKYNKHKKNIWTQ